MVQIIPTKTNIGSEIGQALGMGLQQGASSALQNKLAEHQLLLRDQLGSQSNLNEILLKQQLASQQGSEMKQRLIDLGIPEDIATLYSNSTEGGKTAILQNILDLEQRGLLGEGLFNKSQQPRQAMEEKGQKEFAFPKLSSEKGLKPNELIKREDKREQTNIPLYNETNAKLKNFNREGISINRLEQLNKSNKLPTGLKKFNINPKTGELIFPALENPETQLFVKTVNDFTTKAKDSYGARVTNFELDRFLKRLPTLANSPEGRQLIIDQMKIINDLDSLEEESLIDVYNHYGVGKINAQEAKRIAKEYRKEREEQILKKFDSIKAQEKLSDQDKSSTRPTLEEIFG